MDNTIDNWALSYMITHAQRISEYASAALWSESHREHLVQMVSKELESLADEAGFRLVPIEDDPSEETA